MQFFDNHSDQHRRHLTTSIPRCIPSTSTFNSKQHRFSWSAYSQNHYDRSQLWFLVLQLIKPWQVKQLWFLVLQLTKPLNIKQHSGSWFTNSQNLRNSTPVLGHPTHETKANITNHSHPQQPEFDTAPKTTFTTPLSRIDAFVNSSFVRTPTRTQGNHQASHDSTTCSINSLHCITVASHLASLHLIHEYHDDQLEQRQSIRHITESFTSATNNRRTHSNTKRLDI
eukprot:gene18599-20468_t